MRKFYVENEVKERFSLWGNRVFMVEPSGLGIKHDASYIRIGNSFLRNKKKQITQAEIGGKIEFVDPGANERFHEFYNFCARAESLHLIYDPGDGNEYVRDIDITEAQKTEKTGATLPITVTFTCKSLYYLQDNNKFMFEPSESEKRYGYRYDFIYKDHESYEATVNNNGHVEAPFDCTINGYCVNPSISIMRNGETLYEVVFQIVIEAGESIRYSSRDGELEATFLSGSEEINLMPILDISKDNFFKIPVGDSKIVFNSESTNTNIVTITIYKMFEVV